MRKSVSKDGTFPDRNRGSTKNVPSQKAKIGKKDGTEWLFLNRLFRPKCGNQAPGTEHILISFFRTKSVIII